VSKIESTDPLVGTNAGKDATMIPVSTVLAPTNQVESIPARASQGMKGRTVKRIRTIVGSLPAVIMVRATTR